MESQSMYAPRAIPGRDANLPPYIEGRMKAISCAPTWTQLSLGTGIPLATLQLNLRGNGAIKLTSAKKIADFLEVTVDDLIENIPALVSL